MLATGFLARYVLFWSPLAGSARCLPKPDPKEERLLPEQNVTLTLLARDWPSHEMVTRIAAIVLQEELHYPVNIVNVADLSTASQPTAQDFESLATGLFDANLELWMSAEKQAAYDRFVAEAQLAVQLGTHQVFSYEGMYIPVYAGDTKRQHFATSLRLQEYSDVRLVRGDDAGSQEICSMPEWNCADDLVWRPPYCAAQGTGVCETQLLRGPAGYFKGLTEQRIEANGLNMSVVYTTVSTLKAEVWRAYASEQRFIFHNWEPNMPIPGLDTDSFRRVRFSPWTPSCKQAKPTPMNGTSCDDPARQLQKAVSKRLNSSRDARHFVKAFQLDQSDYDAMFEEYLAADGSVEMAACRWLLRVGSDRWQTWVKYTHQGPFEVGFLGPHHCWPVLWAQMGLLVLSIFACDCFRWTYLGCMVRGSKAKDEGVCCSDGDAGERVLSSREVARLSARRNWSSYRQKSCHSLVVGGKSAVPSVHQRAGQTLTWARHAAMLLMGRDTAAGKFRSVMWSRKLGFFGFRRCELDFISGSGLCMIPENGQALLRMDISTNPHLQLFWYIVDSSMKNTLLRAFQYATAVGTLATLVHIANEYAWHNNITTDKAEPWSHEWGTHLSQVVDDFKMLPTMLIVFKVMTHISRWSNWLGYAGSIVGRIGDLALIIGALGGEVKQAVDVEGKSEGIRVRRLQFQFFRYLTAAHCLAYHGLDARLPETAFDICTALHRVGLLTEDEARRLVSAARGGMHVTVLTWVSVLWHKEVEAREGEADNHPNCQNFMENLMKLRSAMASLRSAAHFERAPDVTDGMLFLVTYLLLFFVLLAYPLKFNTDGTCFQPWAYISALLFFVTYDGLLGMQKLLARSPFDPEGDCVNADNLICGAEEMAFYMIRAAYADGTEGKEAPVLPQDVPDLPGGPTLVLPLDVPDLASGTMSVLPQNVPDLPGAIH